MPIPKDSGGVCGHFGSCGGCSFQDTPYPEQLERKREEVSRVVSPFYSCTALCVKPSPDVFYYRNKMEFAFGHGREGEICLGQRERNRFDRLVNLEECRILSPETAALLSGVRRWGESLSTYDARTHRGFLRYLVVREGKNTGERMVHLITGEGGLDEQGFRESLAGTGVRVDTVLWSVYSGVADVAGGDVRSVISGDGTIQETLGGLRFRVSPKTFFQTNTRGAEVLYGTVAGFLNAGGSAETLFDFYCGSGTIGLFCRAQAKRVVGIESNEHAVEDARTNARVQGINSADFYPMDAIAFLQDPVLMDLWVQPRTAAVMDPPRAGLHRQVRHLLMERPVDRWVYVSCNLQALARDLPVLADVYEVTDIAAVDLFPHTPHVETVVSLKRKEKRA